MKISRMILAGMVAALAVCSAASWCGAAEVIFVEGKAQVRSPDSEGWRALEKGMTVDAGDSVRTARRSRVEIAIDPAKHNTVQIGPNTLVVLNAEVSDQIDRIDLARGRVYSHLESLQAGLGFEVTTPSAVAGVRGSSYMVYSERDTDEVSAYKDTVFLKTYDAGKNLSSEVMLPEGFKTFIDRFETAGVFSQISLREFERFDNVRDDLVDHARGIERDRSERMRERERQEGEAKGKTELEKLVDQAASQAGAITTVIETKELQDQINTDQQVDNRESSSSEEEEHHITYH